jgi:hypothetical protein
MNLLMYYIRDNFIYYRINTGCYFLKTLLMMMDFDFLKSSIVLEVMVNPGKYCITSTEIRKYTRQINYNKYPTAISILLSSLIL